MEPDTLVGIAVAGAELAIAIRPAGEAWTAAHDEGGIATLVSRLTSLQPALVVLEATGGLEVGVSAALAIAGLPVAMVNPQQVRRFAQDTGLLAGTDALDAQVLAHFAEVVRPAPRSLDEAQAELLGAMLARRREVIGLVLDERQRFATAPAVVQPWVRRHLTWLEEEQADLDQQLWEAVQASPLWRAHEDLYDPDRSAPEPPI